MIETATALDVRLLGHADVVVSGRSVKFAKRPTTLAMIAYLILRKGIAVSRESLAYTLFPDDDEEAALANLRRYLYLAGKALPERDADPWLVVDNETVRWNAAAGASVDALSFERLASDPATHERAVDLYVGDLMEDCYDDWILGERERLRAIYFRTLEALVERHREARAYASALACAHRILASDTWREDVVRQAMSLRYDSGDTPGALVEYDRFAERLRDEMNLVPMPETLALRDAIRANRSLVGARATFADEPSTPRATRAHRLPFFGREEERAKLRHAWDRAARGFGNVVILSGEAGIGKTRLVGEIARLVESEGGRAYGGETASPESPPYQCLVEALRSALPVLEASPLPPLTTRVLARILPDLPATANVELAALAPEREATRLLEAIARAVEHVAASRPLLLVLEDLHWAAETTIDAIAAIARRIARTRALVVGTYRLEETPPSHPLRKLVHALGAEQRVSTIQLGRFDRGEVARILATSAIDDPNLLDRMYAFSEGNPLFLSEAVADALERGTSDVASAPRSETIGSVIAARTDRLSDRARTIAEIAAICVTSTWSATSRDSPRARRSPGSTSCSTVVSSARRVRAIVSISSSRTISSRPPSTIASTPPSARAGTRASRTSSSARERGARAISRTTTISRRCAAMRRVPRDGPRARPPTCSRTTTRCASRRSH